MRRRKANITPTEQQDSLVHAHEWPGLEREGKVGPAPHEVLTLYYSDVC